VNDGSRLPPRFSLLVPIGTAVVLLVMLAIWLTRTQPFTLREQLKMLQFWSLEACVALVIGLGVIIGRDVYRRAGRDDIVRMAALAGLALALTLFVAPRTNRIYYDEQIYQSIGHNLADLRRAQMCLDGNVEYGRLQCSAGEYNKQPYAYPHLLSLVYRIAGVDAQWAFIVNAVAMALTVCAVYLVVLVMFSDRRAALFAGLIVALTPQQLVWSATAAVEPLASLASVAALLAAAHFARSRSTTALLGVGVATAYAVQFRPESVLIVPVLGLLLGQLAADEVKGQRVWWVGVICLALVAVHVGHLYSIRNESWGTSEARLSLSYLAPNFQVNGRFYAGDERFPVAYTLLALAGLFASGHAVPRLTMVLYFLVFFGLGLLFYAGSYNYGADVRYSLMTYPPLAILGGLGAARIAGWLDRAQGLVPGRWVMAAGLGFQFLWYMPAVRATTEEAWAARADVRFAEAFAAALPPNSYVLTHNPGMFHLWGVNAGQMSLIVDQPGRLRFFADRYAGGVYLHWNFWCNVDDPVQQTFCRRALEMGTTTLVGEYRERGQPFALYRFEPAALPNTEGHPP
jgi:hypothetical protein